jgi:hypothetical protein
MPLPISDDQGSQDETNVDTLGEVRLISFKAEPASIGPFGASTLSWHVEGPTGFQLELNLAVVPKTGQRVVQPVATTTYTLSARAGNARRTLGHVTVSVDSSSCETFEPLLNPRVTLENALKVFVGTNHDVYFRVNPSTIGFGKTPQLFTPIVSFAPGVISFSLRLAKHQAWFPDPSIDIDASFGLTVIDGALAAIAQQVSVSIDVPFWAWAIPGAVPALAIALDMGKADAFKSTREMIDGLVGIINFNTIPSPGKRLRSIRIDNGNNGNGIIEVTACPHDLLVKLAAISASVSIE